MQSNFLLKFVVIKSVLYSASKISRCSTLVTSFPKNLKISEQFPAAEPMSNKELKSLI